MLLLCLLVGSVNGVWAADQTGTITFGTNDVKINAASVNGNDDQGNSWTITTVGTTSFTANAAYYQVGSSSNPATSITFTTTLEADQNITAFSAKFGGFKGTAGTVTLKVGDTAVGTGSLNGTNDITVSSSSSASGKVLTVTVTGISKGVKCYNISYTYAGGGIGVPVDPSVTIDSESIAVGGTATISGPDGLTMNFESDKTDVATVSTEGVVTGKAAGSATITASWDAVADKYNAGSQKFTVNVIQTTIYEKVIDANQLVAGNEYILVATNSGKAMGAQGSNIRGCVDVDIDDDKVSITTQPVAVMTLGGTEGAWTFLTSDNSKYLAYSGSSNHVYSNDDATDDASKWVVTNDFLLESANVSGRVLQYNSSNPRFACYNSTQQAAVLFVKQGSAINPKQVKLAASGYASYCSPFALDLTPTEDYAAWAVTATNNTEVTFTKIQGAVPAATPFILYGEGMGGQTITLPVATGATTAVAGNMLVGTLEETSVTTVNGEYTNFGLSNGEFVKLNNGTIPANKAYLPILTTNVPAAARLTIVFDEGMATGIANINRESTDNRYFNLNGQQVKTPQKGMFIVNGKKVIIK